MKKIMNWVLAAAFFICGASAFTSCSNNDDVAVTPCLAPCDMLSSTFCQNCLKVRDFFRIFVPKYLTK